MPVRSPLTEACPTLVTDNTLSLQYEVRRSSCFSYSPHRVLLAYSNARPQNFTAEVSTAVHTSGSQQANTGSALHSESWYFDTFLPKMKNYHKGPLVWSKGKVSSEASDAGRQWAIVNGSVYDLTDYFYTVRPSSSSSPRCAHRRTDSSDSRSQIDLLRDDKYSFLDEDLANLWTAQPGGDLTGPIKDLGLDWAVLDTNMACIQTLFYKGETDFRKSARCQFQPNMLLAFGVLIMATILTKFLAALQFGSKRMPEQRDKFVICASASCSPSPSSRARPDEARARSCRSSSLLHRGRGVAQEDDRLARDAQLRRQAQAHHGHLRRHDRRRRQRPPDAAHRARHPRRRPDGRARPAHVQVGRRGLEAAQLRQGVERPVRGRGPCVVSLSLTPPLRLHAPR